MRREILLSKRTSRRIEGPSAVTPAQNHQIGRAKGKCTYFPTLDTLYVYILNHQ
ncbi:hypothetical protein Bca4012_050277 [Brassica carinata]